MCGVEGEVPSSLSLGGYKGGCSLSEEREHPPLSGSSAKSCTDYAAPAALHPPIPREGGKSKGDSLFEKRVSPFVWQQCKELHPPSPAKGGIKRGNLFEKRIPPLSGSGAQRRTIHAAPAALQPPIPREGGNQKGQPLRKENPPFVWQWRSAPHYPCSADGAATTHPPQGRLKRDTLFRKKVSPFIFPFPRSTEISVPAPVQDYFLKLSFSVTDRLNTRCSGVQSLLSRQK